VIEESACSGLFGAESTVATLVLTRDLKAHDLHLREATCLEPRMDRAWTQGFRRQAGPEHEEYFRLCRRYAQTARMVQLSEESIVAGCEEVLEELH